jgi:hypothetical protein
MRGAITIGTTTNRHSERFFFAPRGLNGCAAVFKTRARSPRLGIGIAISPSFTVGFFFRTGMNSSLLEECWSKLGRAKEHAKTLDAEIRRFLDTDPYRVDPEHDLEQRRYLFRLKVLQPIPQRRFALIMGDAIHNAKSALDYLAWRLAGSDIVDRDTLFPIFLYPSAFNKRAKKKLWRIHPEALTELRQLQPYNRPNPTIDPLWLLHDLDARDKHKLLTMTQTIPKEAVIFIGGGPGWSPFRFRQGPFDDNAIIADIDIPPNVPEEEVKMGSNITFDIAFEKRIVGAELFVRGTLDRILDAIENILLRFEALLPSNFHWLIWF